MFLSHGDLLVPRKHAGKHISHNFVCFRLSKMRAREASAAIPLTVTQRIPGSKEPIVPLPCDLSIPSSADHGPIRTTNKYSSASSCLHG